MSQNAWCKSVGALLQSPLRLLSFCDNFLHSFPIQLIAGFHFLLREDSGACQEFLEVSVDQGPNEWANFEFRRAITVHC